MFNDWEKFSDAYQKTSPAIREFIDSNVLPIYLRTKLGSINVDSKTARDLILYCNNFILNISNETELNDYLSKNNILLHPVKKIIDEALQLFIQSNDYTIYSAVNISFVDRINYVNKSSLTKKYFLGDINSRIKLLNLLQENNIDSINKSKKFIITVYDIILGFYKIEDTVPLLQQELGLDAKTAALLGADVLDFLAPLSDPNWQPPVEVESDDSNSKETVTSTAEEQASVPTSFTEIVTAPDTKPAAVMSTIPELRTMAGDMQEERSPVRSTFNAAAAIDEPVYTSTQPTIEKKVENVPSYTAPMYEQPKPNLDVPIDKPRWG